MRTIGVAESIALGIAIISRPRQLLHVKDAGGGETRTFFVSYSDDTVQDLVVQVEAKFRRRVARRAAQTSWFSPAVASC